MSLVLTSVTTEQLLAMPEDGVDRELIRGELRERPMTTRNRFHTRTVARITYCLENWRRSRPGEEGEVHTAEVGTILRRDPDSTVGIDVAYFSAIVMARQNDSTTLIEGVPVLAVEVLSPSDKLAEIREKVIEYLDSGVQIVWVVDPYFRTVQVHRRGFAPVQYNCENRIRLDEGLPGLDVAVIELFERP